MLRSLVIFSFAFCLFGCGSSNDNGTGGNGGGSGSDGADMSGVASGDLAMTLPPDMQPAYGCHALLGCEASCSGASCGTCQQSATMQARTLYQNLSRCVRRECFPHPDGGAAPCMQGGGTPSPQCTMCQADAIKATGSCGADTTYCGTCYSQYSACEADLP